MEARRACLGRQTGLPPTEYHQLQRMEPATFALSGDPEVNPAETFGVSVLEAVDSCRVHDPRSERVRCPCLGNEAKRASLEPGGSLEVRDMDQRI